MKPARVATTLLAAGLLLGGPTRTASPQGRPVTRDTFTIITGRLADQSGQPVADAEVSVVGTRLTARSDARGGFRIAGAPVGLTSLQVRRIGFRSRQISFMLMAGDRRERVIILEPGASPLPEIVVQGRWGKPSRLAHTLKYDDFYRRRQTGLGNYFTREQIAAMHATTTLKILQQVPGFGIYQSANINAIRLLRCNEVPPNIGLYVDGQRWTWGETRGVTVPINAPLSTAAITELDRQGELAMAELVQAIERIRPSEIEAVEIYRGPGTYPPEFLDRSCAIVVIWTREGRGGG